MYLFEHSCFIPKTDKCFSFEVWVSLVNIHRVEYNIYAVDITTMLRNSKANRIARNVWFATMHSQKTHWHVNNVLIYLMISSTALDWNIACHRGTVTNRIDACRWGNVHSQNVDDVVIARYGFHRDNFLNGNECAGLSSLGILFFHLYHHDLSLYHHSDTWRFLFHHPRDQSSASPPTRFLFRVVWCHTRRILDLRDGTCDVSIFVAKIAFFI